MPHAAAQICADASFPQHSAVGLPRVSRRPFSRGPPLHSAASLQWEARHSPRGQRTCAQASKLSATQEQDIEGLDKSYCDDFVCSSSPAVEQAVRSLALDIQQPRRWTRQLFAKDVQYKGLMRSFKGVDRYSRHLFIADNVEKAEVTVQQLKMEGLGTALITWRLQGRVLKVLDVDVRVNSTFELNMLTGRVESHTDRWELSGCSPPAAAALTLLRVGWAFRQKSMDVREDADRVLDKLQVRQGPEITGDPSDPRKFFIEDDTLFKDAVLFAAVLALFWVFFKAQYMLADL